jgi:cell division protein FtsB
MTESQKAFKTWFDVNYAAYYGQQAPIAVKAAWQAAEAYGRKQALEELEAEREQVAENIKQIEIGELKP